MLIPLNASSNLSDIIAPAFASAPSLKPCNPIGNAPTVASAALVKPSAIASSTLNADLTAPSKSFAPA